MTTSRPLSGPPPTKRAALLLYNLLLLLLSPLLFLYLLWRRQMGKEDPGEQWAERWGRLPETVVRDPRRPRFWVHAVSVGEVMAAVPVLRELRRHFPEAYILLSTTTTTGREVAQKQMPPADEVVYYPLDFPWVVSRALDAARPDIVLLMEWEIWPGFLTAARRHGARVAVLNGRISDKGLHHGRGGMAAFFVRLGLEAVDLFAMQSEEDARRAGIVGADPARIVTLGNTKFDEATVPLTSAERDALRADLGIPQTAPVWVCGSTRNDEDAARPDEEVYIAQAFQEVHRHFPDLWLIVAPRHLERADKAAEPFVQAGFEVIRRSKSKGAPAEARGQERILLLDTFGELGRVYAIADVAFVGGSLVKRGGQSVFQPLAQGVPALFGRYMNNQRDIAALSKAEGVGFEVQSSEELAAEVTRLLSLPAEQKEEISRRARALIERNQGVSARCVEVVAQLLEGGDKA